MFKTFIKSLGRLFSGMVGFALFTLIYTQPTAFASTHRTLDATPTTTPTYTATLTVALPTGGTLSGHVGTKIQITGNGFAPSSPVSLSVITDPAQCAAGTGGVAMIQPDAAATTDASGNFMAAAAWPGAAVQPMTYYVCAHAGTASAVASNTPFTVAGDVTVNVSNQTVEVGNKVEITGTNWLPVQPLNVSITSGQGGNTIVNGQTIPDNNGTFKIDLTIPDGTAAGTYGVNVVAANDANLNKYVDAVVTVTAKATPTVEATATSEPTPTPTPTSTPTPPANNSGGGNPALTWLIFGLGGIGVILVIVGLTMFLTNSHNS